MIDESSMYWLTRMDYVCQLLRGFGIAGIVAGVISLIPFFATLGDEAHASVSKVVRWLCPTLLLIGMLGLVGRALTPTTRELAVIKVVPAIVNNEDLKRECSELYTLTKSWLKDTLKVEGTTTQNEATKRSP